MFHNRNMMLANIYLLCVITYHFTCHMTDADKLNDKQRDNARGKRFGEGFEHLKVSETHIFPNITEFINYHIHQRIPLLIRGGAKHSKAFTKWSDEYFLSLDIPADSEVLLETIKKESRTQDTKTVHFQEFVRVYNNSELYMVETVPSFLRADINIPCALRCAGINLVDSVMWYSSGGTKSVVHTDSVDNLNCLYRGRKHIILVDPKHADSVDMDHAEGSYSSVDVDDVDYLKFPGLAQIEYYNISVEAGDCLYIPYYWIHQVRSYENNIAVNLWWDHFAAKNVDTDACSQVDCSEDFSLADVEFLAIDSIMWSPSILEDRFLTIIGVNVYATFDKFKKHFIPLVDLTENMENAKIHIEEILFGMFEAIDLDMDGSITKAEVKQISDWKSLMDKVKYLVEFMKESTETESESEDIIDDSVISDDTEEIRSRDEL